MIKNITKVFLLFVFLLVSFSSFGQNIRGFYITGLGSWLGNSTKETAILNYAQGNGYNYINFYDLGTIDWTSSTDKENLASFMRRARTQFGVTQFGAVVELYSYFAENVLPYNNSRTRLDEKFDIINLEFEYWVKSSIGSFYCNQFLIPNGLTCDTAGAFRFAWKQFTQIDSVCAILGLTSEMYLGWPTKGQMQQFALRADRILLHAYRPTDSDVYSYSKNRLIDIASVGAGKKVIPLFSGEQSFMGPWLTTHPQSRPYQTYSDKLAAETGSFRHNIDLEGYHWFTYDDMPKTILASATITAGGPLSFCEGGSVVLTANSGSSYLWTPGGATTRSITATAPGSYTVKVTNSIGVTITSAQVVVTYTTSGTIPTVTASGPVSFCPGGSVTLTSSTADSYLWSGGETTQSIVVNTSGSYTVIAGNAGCTAVSVPVIVNAAAPPETPTISPNGNISICTGSSIELTSSLTSSYSWSNGATTQFITVSTPGNYSVITGSGLCSATSSVVNITETSSPVIPTITAGGPTSFCPGLNVVLTSSESFAYLWSDGSTSRSITVSESGNYSVTTGSGTCSATSSVVIVNANSTPSVPVITAYGSLNICQGNQLILTSSAAGGYLWSNGETTRTIVISSAGDYTVQVFGGPNCFSISEATVVTVQSLPTIPVISVTGSTTLTTAQPTVTLSSSPANSYLWSNNQTSSSITVNTHGQYYVTVTGSNGCTVSSMPITISTVNCTPPPIPTISLNGSGVLTPGQSIVLTSSFGNGYLWSTGETTSSITVSEGGNFTVNVYSAANCFSASLPVTITLEIPTGIDPLTPESENTSFFLYPNPASIDFNVVFTSNARKKIIFNLFDVTGREILTREIICQTGENYLKVNTNEFSSGIYFAGMNSGEKKQMIKVIIE